MTTESNWQLPQPIAVAGGRLLGAAWNGLLRAFGVYLAIEDKVDEWRELRTEPESNELIPGPAPAGVQITANARGFHQYGDPVTTTYGEKVDVYESSAARGPHCWLRIFDDGKSQVTPHHGLSIAAHLTADQATAVRDRLDAWLNEIPTRWAAER